MSQFALSDQVVGAPGTTLGRTLERAAVVNRYLKIRRPTTEDADAHAEELGVKRRYFYKLVRIFEERRATPVDVEEVYSKKRVDPRVDKVISDVIADLGLDASLEQVHIEARTRCAKRKLPPPSGTAVRERLGAIRKATPACNTRGVVADHCALLLPVLDHEGKAQIAVLSAVIHGPTGRVLGHHLDVGAPGASALAGAILDALAAPRGRDNHAAEPLDFQLQRGTGSGWDRLQNAIMLANTRTQTSLATPRSAGKALMRVFGTRLGRIHLKPRLTNVGRTQFPGYCTPVHLEGARATVRALVEQHNSALSSRLSLRDLLPPNTAAPLKEAMAQIVQGGQSAC